MRILQESYPSGFSLTELNSITSFAGRKRYIERFLTKIGEGSSRIAYKVDDEKVLKFAKNSKGMAQNENEVVYSNQYDILARTFECDNKSTWVEMELGRRPKAADLKRIFGVGWNFLFTLTTSASRFYFGKEKRMWGDISLTSDADKLYDQVVEYKDGCGPKPHINENLINFIFDVSEFFYDCQPDKAFCCDMRGLRNWAIVNREGKEHLVLIDYGFNEETYKQFYAKDTKNSPLPWKF